LEKLPHLIKVLQKLDHVILMVTTTPLTEVKQLTAAHRPVCLPVFLLSKL